ncbi:MAG: hypothetical protein H6610_02575 [Ignavibacteriales bacterium]|nr:hypothetical protein [Ignavibacteriales bacterium]MCB9218330.1 hypothetical protein [Ignavibacteriales bacterium]MCB9260626.1 hypothetical protein [Ignavibacteriales bacterium]
MKNENIIKCILLGFALFLPKFSLFAEGNNSVEILVSKTASSIEINVANLLKERLLEKSINSVKVTPSNSLNQNSSVKIILGIPQNHGILVEIFYKNRIDKLSEIAPGPEGFLLRTISLNPLEIIIAGVDERGCLYGVGEFLRQIKIEDNGLVIENNLNIRTAPAFEIRGTQFGQSHVAKRLAKVRDWTEDETKRVVLDYALAGANIFNVDEGPMFDFIKSFGLMTQGSFGANTAGEEVPEEWNASESIGRIGYVCPSVPDAREFMLKKCEDYFKNSPTFDLVKFHGGDGGGCECDRCNPYGLTFIKLVEDMAEIIHQYHPTSKIYFTNQKFDNEDDFAIFNYLQEKPRTWLWAWGYGPGSDATTWQPGHRQTHRMDLFKYPGFGPYGLYPQEILHQLPPQQKLVFYNEITHWKYAQHGYAQMYPRADKNGDIPPHWSHEIYERRPDQFLTMVYNRLTFYAWPKYYHRVFNDLMRYGIGDITHSSGHHDHFNQWMWQRLLWSPRITVEEVVNEYCKNWFGDKAAPFMEKAIFQLEENLEEISNIPLDKKDGINKYYDLVKKAGEQIPQEELKDNWLWQMYMQKATLDKYVKLKVIKQKEMQTTIENNVKEILSNSNFDEIKKLLKLFENQNDTKEMISLKEEARELGEQSNKIFGVRNDGYFNLEHDFIGLGWLKRQLERVRNSKNKNEIINLLRMIVDYDNPGEGGFYDNLGTFNNAPNVVFGYPYDHGQPYLDEMMDESNRPSQKSMHFTQDEKQGVTLEYRDLDTSAYYSIRFTLVRPWYQSRYDFRMNQKSESIYADDIVLAKELEIPYKMSDFFTFDIPYEATKDGKLILRFEKAHDVAVGDRVSVEQWRNSGGWGTIVSEVWLIKK